MKNFMKEEKKLNPQLNSDLSVFDDIKYICNSSKLITDSLQKGFDVAQLPNGDVIITEIKTINVQYTWDETKQKMVRISQS